MSSSLEAAPPRLVPAYIERLVPYQPGKPIEELEREYGVRNAIKLASNENPAGPSPRALDAIKAHLAASHRYPDAAAFALRSALAAHHGVSPNEVVVTNGSNELIDLICRTFAAPGEHAVIGVPSFPCYRLGLVAANIDFTEVPLVEHLSWDLDAMLSAIRPTTRILFLANPNNPTGAYVGGSALRDFLSRVPAHVLVALDEAYVEFPEAEDYETGLSMRDLRERLILLRTFSKAYGLAALRVGYGIAPPAVVDYLNRVRAPFNVGSLAQAAAIAALDDHEHVSRYVAMNREVRERVTRALRALGLTVAKSQANFVLVDVGRPGKEVYEALLHHGVIVRPMAPPIANWLRVTVGTPSENERFVSAMREVIR